MRSQLFQALLPAAITVLAGSIGPQASALTYYVSSSNGDDAHTGTSMGQAWQTLERVASVQYALQPGDQVLLERGGIYRGTLTIGSSGTNGAPIIYGSYGSGPLPIISGSEPITGWEPYQGNVWSTSVSDQVSDVYMSGQRATLARYPNSGWLRMDLGSNTSLQDADLTHTAGYWTGATAVIRASNWNYDLATITGSSPGSLTFADIHDDPGPYQWGYFLCNKLSELDSAGEWYYDATEQKLYVQSPGNVDPNTMLIEAAVHLNGVAVAWERQYVRIQDIGFKHQTVAGVNNEGGKRITVSNCDFRDMYQAIRSYGSNNTYRNSTFRDIHATGVLLIDNNTKFTANTMTDIAMIPGAGETNWGYRGISMSGTGNEASHNTLSNIGYTGIASGNNTLVEYNLLSNCLALLNDGACISFDNADGMIVRHNVITGMTGNLESSAPDFPNYEHISHGIYFGNTSIKNTLVEYNTVANCAGSGIHVDHTMASTGNLIRNNVLFNNTIQLSISDYSNNMGPAATPPYHIAEYAEEYTGNAMYCLTPDQLCMRQYNCYSAEAVDFGLFANNRYYDPYNELSILIRNTFVNTTDYFTLDRWRNERSEDDGSTRSPLHLSPFAVTDSIGGELVDNGDFTDGVSGWGGWPSNAIVELDNTFLDNGALKATIPDNSVYPEFSMRNPLAFPVVGGEWYRMAFSLQSTDEGQLAAAVKGLSQMNNINTIGERDLPFGPERRDVVFIFQAGLSDNALVQFTNSWLDPVYWIDNISLKQVHVEPLDPSDKQILLYNTADTDQAFSLEGCWSDLNGAFHGGTITLSSFSSIILVKEEEEDCAQAISVEGVGRSVAGLGLFPNPAKAGGSIKVNGATDSKVRLVGMNGRVAAELAFKSGTDMISLPADLAPGIYAVVVLGRGRMPAKLVVQ